MAHASAGSFMFSLSSVKQPCEVVRYVHILVLACLVRVPAHPRARASVLSAPVQSHAMPLWGPRRAAGVASAASAPLADPGSSPMTTGWAGQLMPNIPHLAARAPPNTGRGMGKGKVAIAVAITVATSKLRWQLRSQVGVLGYPR